MATVRITNDIRNHVRREILSLYAARTSAIHAKIREIDMIPVASKYFNEEYVRKGQELNADPKGQWINEATQQTFQVRMPAVPGTAETRHTRVSIPYHRPLPIPLRAHQYSFAIPVPASAPEHARLVELLVENERLDAEGRKLADQLLGILNQCGTLKQVLEVWPSALDFMPPEAKEQHNRVVNKRTRAARVEALAIDDSTKASLLTARLLAGASE